ncbi:phosphatidylinositol-glycan biosynthesis class S protein [Melampsora americana]|nr:phosphatidylinositol-glycan biosynthesis class S protein [Melampsora americana]
MSSTLTSSSHSPNLQQSFNVRIKIILSFWLVIILSLPIWWQTTKIERKPLPKSALEYWNSLHSCPIRFPIDLTLNFKHLTIDSLNQEIKTLSFKLQNQRYDDQDEIDIITARCFDFNLKYQLDSSSTNDPIVIYHHESLSNLAQTSSRSDGIPIRLSSQNPSKELLKRLAPLSRSSVSIQGKDSRVVKYSANLKLMFSLMNEDITKSNDILGWEIKESIRDHLSPILTNLSPLHNFTFETQILHYSPLTSQPTELHQMSDHPKKEHQKLFIIEEDDLKAFINEADWSLASPVSMDPVLHFVLYIPSVEHRPFKIRRKDGSLDRDGSFIRPQWGSVIIYNPERISNRSSSTLSVEELTQPMQIFKSHLLNLLGISNKEIEFKTQSIELDSILRRRILESSLNSINDLNVIFNLIDQQTNMRVGSDVQRQVKDSLKSLQMAQDELKTNQSMIRKLKSSIFFINRSSILSSQAVFNPSMLSLLYFPDEHKYAVYTPLFGPIFVPLLVCLIKELKGYLSKKRLGIKEKNE